LAWLLQSHEGLIGAALLALVVLIAVAGPFIALHSLGEPIAAPSQGPSLAAPLGTDALGRDVLSRVLHGGFSVLWVTVVAIVPTYLLGIATGMAAGLGGGWVDAVLMRAVDVLLVFPSMLLLLVLVTGAGTGTLVVIVGLVLVLSPGVARLVRIATLEVAVTGYVEAAVARGEGQLAIMRREILPNILHYILADFGIRFSGAVTLAASMNFLGLGANPPAANWGLMIAENRLSIYTNVLAILAPATLLAALAVAINLLGDAYVQTHRRGGNR
jgi:ABC-type dipeptide/oligopeptide/nickel transport system permease subunit